MMKLIRMSSRTSCAQAWGNSSKTHIPCTGCEKSGAKKFEYCQERKNEQTILNGIRRLASECDDMLIFLIYITEILGQPLLFQEFKIKWNLGEVENFIASDYNLNKKVPRVVGERYV